jgi:hypothetical protein
VSPPPAFPFGGTRRASLGCPIFSPGLMVIVAPRGLSSAVPSLRSRAVRIASEAFGIIRQNHYRRNKWRPISIPSRPGRERGSRCSASLPISRAESMGSLVTRLRSQTILQLDGLASAPFLVCVLSRSPEAMGRRVESDRRTAKEVHRSHGVGAATVQSPHMFARSSSGGEVRPGLSVVVPAYNEEQRLGDSLSLMWA